VTISYADAERILLLSGYSPFHDTSKVKGFALGSTSLYLKKPKPGMDGVERPLVVHADDVKDFHKLMSISGVERSKGRDEYYHNANMIAFGRRLNDGEKPTRYGYDFDFSDVTSMSAFLQEIG
jgi:hypothetical protein